MTQNSSILHNVRLIPQPTQTSCWAATIAMLKGSTVAAIQAATPSELVLPDGSLKNYSRQEDWATGTRKFAMAHGLQYAAPQTWTAAGLHRQLSRGPMAFDLLWNAQNYASGAGSPGHLVLLVGMSGEGSGTTVTINDPWPPNRGDVFTRNYADLLQAVPTLTYRVFWR